MTRRFALPRLSNVRLCAACILLAASCSAQRDTPLDDTRWVVSDIAGTPVPVGRARLSIGFGGQVAADAGCGRIDTVAEIGAGRISIAAPSPPLSPCPATAAQRDSAVRAALSLAATFRQGTTTLTLFDAAGSPVMRLRAPG
ncbi:MAG: META domain-containing protein [Pseudomonadota bacterium]